MQGGAGGLRSLRHPAEQRGGASGLQRGRAGGGGEAAGSRGDDFGVGKMGLLGDYLGMT